MESNKETIKKDESSSKLEDILELNSDDENQDKVEPRYVVVPMEPINTKEDEDEYRGNIIKDEIAGIPDRDQIMKKKFGASPDQVQVEYFSNEKSVKERLQIYFIKNQRSSLRIRIFNFIIKLLTCVLYVTRVQLDDTPSLISYSLPDDNLLRTSSGCWNRSIVGRTAEEFRNNPCINWDAVLYIKTPRELWIAQVFFAVLSYTQTLLISYLTFKGNLLQTLSQISFLLDTLTSFTLIITISWPTLRHVYIPIFLNCWLAKRQLENMLNDLNRAMQKSSSALAQRLMILAVTMSCLVFTGACAIQHLQRGGNKQFSFFESFWYIVVTFSTVGYGDIYPDIWPSQLFMILLIIAALVVFPSQFEQLALIYMEKQKRGTSYSRQRAQTERHVVVCATSLQQNIIMDFLNEFYAHPMLQNFYVVLLSPSELDQNLAMILQVPIWSQRVIYIQGSALNTSDLMRAQMEHAEACFIMAARNYHDRQASDQHSILRSWAIRDFAPNCCQYVHLLKPENKMHVQHAKYVVCEDEFKYALLANNCLCPGLSTFVTLLLHTSRGREGSGSQEEWQKFYGKCSGNEIYHIRLGDSKFFAEYEEKTFTYASFHAHRKFGVGLIGIQPDNDQIKINPGPNYIMKANDICFYMSITKEENSSLLIAATASQNLPDDDLNLTNFTRKISFRRPSSGSHGTSTTTKSPEKNSLIKPKTSSSSFNANKPSSAAKMNHSRGNKLSVDDSFIDNASPSSLVPNTVPLSSSSNNLDLAIKSGSISLSKSRTFDNGKSFIRGSPPIPPYVCCSATICHLLREKQHLCCLKLNQECSHSSATQIKDYKFEKKVIILAAEYSNIAIYNFIVPLRSYSIPKDSLSPILLMFEKEPSDSFLEIIRYFPLVYWMKGSIDRLEDLLRAGINESEYLIIVNKERSNTNEEAALEDCNTILSVQFIFRMFPKVRVCSEIEDANNMRFMQFRANDQFSLQISKQEKIESQKGSNIAYLFRLPFAGGNVFSATMLDTLLYQSFVKNYLINFVRLLLGIDQAPGSGHLSCKKITSEDSWIKTYGRLYQSLCSTTYEIPIGIYRTDPIPRDKEKDKDRKTVSTNMEISKIVQTRMEILRISQSYYSADEANEFSYVLINPPYDSPLKIGDVVLIIKPNNILQSTSMV